MFYKNNTLLLLALSLVIGLGQAFPWEREADENGHLPHYEDDEHINFCVLLRNDTLSYQTNREAALKIFEYLKQFPELKIEGTKPGNHPDEVRILQER